MPKSKRTVEAALLRKGFHRDNNRHRYFSYWTMDGRKTPVMTMTSHGSDTDVDDTLLSKMAKQCGLTMREFGEFIECSLTQERYESLLRERGILRLR